MYLKPIIPQYFKTTNSIVLFCFELFSNCNWCINHNFQVKCSKWVCKWAKIRKWVWNAYKLHVLVNPQNYDDGVYFWQIKWWMIKCWEIRKVLVGLQVWTPHLVKYYSNTKLTSHEISNFVFRAVRHGEQEVYKYYSKLSDDLRMDVEEPRSPVMVKFLRNFQRCLSQPTVRIHNYINFTMLYN